MGAGVEWPNCRGAGDVGPNCSGAGVEGPKNMGAGVECELKEDNGLEGPKGEKAVKDAEGAGGTGASLEAWLVTSGAGDGWRPGGIGGGGREAKLNGDGVWRRGGGGGELCETISAGDGGGGRYDP
jgi:hypothetical protein